MGRRHVGISDGRRLGRGGQGRIPLGSLLPHSRHDRSWRHRRRGLRSLPPPCLRRQHHERLGLQAYRFSISWPRVLPDGRGIANRRGLEFYDRLVNALRAASILPFATFNHWDVPQAVAEVGGWLDRETCAWFAEYAAAMAAHLGDRVRFWAPLNEPRIVMLLGYTIGEHPRGLRAPETAIQVGHQLSVAHGMTLQAMRALDPGLQLRLVLDQSGAEPATDSEEDHREAEAASEDGPKPRARGTRLEDR